MNFVNGRSLTRRQFGADALKIFLASVVGKSCITDGLLGSIDGVTNALAAEANPSTLSFDFTLETKYSRKTDSYTQGLFYEYDNVLKKGVLYESGGRYNRSLLRKVEADTGNVIRQVKIPTQFFAEGLTAVDDRLYLLTWRERSCLVYDKETFEQVDEFRYSGEGWGLAFDGRYLVMSDGTSKIRFLDPKTFRQVRKIDVHFFNSNGKRRPVYNLNELEIVDGEIWANVYQQEYVVRIDPKDGELIGNAINFSSLTPKTLKSTEYVLNGLAFDSVKRRLYVTGKCWPTMYVFKVDVKKRLTSFTETSDDV